MIVALEDSLQILSVNIDQQGLIISGVVTATALIISYRWYTRLMGRRYKIKRGHQK